MFITPIIVLAALGYFFVATSKRPALCTVSDAVLKNDARIAASFNRLHR
jgi:hypothetical protein